MSKSYDLLTTAKIDADTFAKFLASIGGESKPNDWMDGRLSKGCRHVWIYRYFQEPEGFDEMEPETIVAIMDKLGAWPIDNFVLEFSGKLETDKLVIDLAIAFAERWNAVLQVSETQIFDLADLKRFRRESKGLPLPVYDDL